MVWQLSSFGERVYGGGEEVPRRKRESQESRLQQSYPSLHPLSHGSSQPWDKTVLSLPGHQVSAQGRDKAKQWDEGAVLSVNQGAVSRGKKQPLFSGSTGVLSTWVSLPPCSP